MKTSKIKNRFETSFQQQKIGLQKSGINMNNIPNCVATKLNRRGS